MAGAAQRAKHRAVVHRLRGRNRGIDIAHRRDGDHAAFDHGGRFHAEEGWRPDHEVSQLTHLNGSDFVCDAVGQRRVDGVFGDVALHAEVVVIPGLLRQRSALHLHAMRHLPGAENHFPDAAHGLRIGGGEREGAEIVQHVFRSDGFPANARLGKGHVLGDVRVQMVADHQHIEMFIDGVEGVGQRWVGGRRQNVRVGAGGDDVRRMAAAGPFGMEGVDGAPADGGEGVFHKTGFIQGVAVQGDLDVHFIGDG
ncbi:Uncharacterised protein [Klebsiella pneumoniae]|nr:Uncharacterised protein [Klebsiella pneumoniae]SXB98678.1 Uncharacterised protein [Klebsiella pneumoniae]SYR72242.1 Uncharacterised protein [Klebsiella pneumoniae]VAR94874.1 Uncharacterised protein [Klebsiella pneumoniae]